MTNPLYQPASRAGNWRQNAVVGGHENDLILADGFWSIAERTLTAIGQQPDDSQFVPAMYNVRHSFELALKEGVRSLSLYLRREAQFEGRAVAADLEKAAVEQWVSNTHKIDLLLARLQVLMTQAGIQALPPDVVAVVIALHDLDPTGQAFRYSKVKDQAKKLVPARPNQVHVDVIALRDLLHEAFRLIAGGLVGGETDALLDLQADFHAEADSWGP
jgi:hypothetical protein